MHGNRLRIEDGRYTNKALSARYDPHLNVTAIRRISGKVADTLLHEVHVGYRRPSFPMRYLRRGPGTLCRCGRSVARSPLANHANI